MTESTRAYLYRIALAVMGLLVAYGVIDEQTGSTWLMVVFAVLGLGSAGLATIHTSTKPEGE